MRTNKFRQTTDLCCRFEFKICLYSKRAADANSPEKLEMKIETFFPKLSISIIEEFCYKKLIEKVSL